jgi:hypothetical protein
MEGRMSAPKSDTATIEARKNRLLELLAQGKSQVDAAEILRVEGYPADDRTIRRDVYSLRGQWGEANMSQYELLREQQLREVEEDKAELRSLREKLDTITDPIEVIDLALKIIDRRDTVAQREMKLTGTAAPTKSIHANISANPEHSTEYLLFREACAGLNNEQLHEVYAVAKALPRTWVAPPIEADFPVRMLPEVTDDFS